MTLQKSRYKRGTEGDWRGIRLHSCLKSRAVLAGRSIREKVSFPQNNDFKKPCFPTSLIPVMTRFVSSTIFDSTLKVELFGEKMASFSSLDAADRLSDAAGQKGDLVLEYKAKDKKQIKTEKMVSR